MLPVAGAAADGKEQMPVARADPLVLVVVRRAVVPWRAQGRRGAAPTASPSNDTRAGSRDRDRERAERDRRRARPGAAAGLARRERPDTLVALDVGLQPQVGDVERERGCERRLEGLAADTSSDVDARQAHDDVRGLTEPVRVRTSSVDLLDATEIEYTGDGLAAVREATCRHQRQRPLPAAAVADPRVHGDRSRSRDRTLRLELVGEREAQTPNQRWKTGSPVLTWPSGYAAVLGTLASYSNLPWCA